MSMQFKIDAQKPTDFVLIQFRAEYDEIYFFFSSRRRHTRCSRDWNSDVCSSDLPVAAHGPPKIYLASSASIRWVAGDIFSAAHARRRGERFKSPSERNGSRSRAGFGESFMSIPRSEERRVGKEFSSMWGPLTGNI